MNSKKVKRLEAKRAKKANIFSKLFDTVDAFDTLVDLERTDIGSLKGTFRLTRSKKKETVKGFFRFTDDALPDAGFKKIKVNYKSLNSMFGNFGDKDDYLGAGRLIRSGNKKFDYRYNGINNKTLQLGTKIAEVSLFPNFIDMFESKRSAKIKGDFRINIDGNFVAMAKGRKSKEFGDNLILRAEFESDFDFINPNNQSFETLA